MKAEHCTVNLQDWANQIHIEVHITGKTRFRIQLILASWLIQLAMLITGFGLELKVDDD